MIFPANSLVMKGLQPGGFTLPYTIISYNGRPERWITPFWQPAYPLHLYSHYILFTANRLCCCCCCYKYKYKYNISAFWGQFLHCVTSPLNAVRFGFLGIVATQYNVYVAGVGDNSDSSTISSANCVARMTT